MIKIGLIGDNIIDEYIHCECNRISPEWPLPVYNELYKKIKKGGSKNVENNLIALGASVNHYCCPDEYASIKKRYIVNDKIVFRCDNDKIFNNKKIFYEFDNDIEYVILSDYNKGYLNNVVDIIKNLKNKKIIVDSKRHISNYRNCFLLKMNEKEFKEYTDNNLSLKELRSTYNINIIIVTLGSKGCIISYENKTEYIDTIIHNVSDVTGAGDIFISVITYYLACGYNIYESALKAVKLASLSVTKFGTYTLTKEDIKSIEEVIVFTNGCFDILHRGHIEYLKKSKQLGTKLIIGLNSDESVKKLKGENRPINNQEDRKILLESLDFVDEVIIFNEDTPYELIKKIKPNILTKGSDYLNKEVIGSDIVEQVVLLPYIKNYSSSTYIERIK